MKEMRMNLLGAAALGLLLITLYAQYADAETRGGRIWRISDDVTFTVDVSSHDHPMKSRERYERNLGRYDGHRLTLRDREIARRLSWYTGVRERRLLRWRSLGHRWNEIGRHLDVPRRVVKAAKGALSWHRFLRRNSDDVWCEVGGVRYEDPVHDCRCRRDDGRNRNHRRH